MNISQAEIETTFLFKKPNQPRRQHTTNTYCDSQWSCDYKWENNQKKDDADIDVNWAPTHIIKQSCVMHTYTGNIRT